MKVKRFLTRDEFAKLFATTTDEEAMKGKPHYVDDNEDEWIEWLYSQGYRLVEVE